MAGTIRELEKTGPGGFDGQPSISNVQNTMCTESLMGITSNNALHLYNLQHVYRYDIPWNFHELMLCSDSLQHSQKPIAAIALFRTVQDVWPQLLKSPSVQGQLCQAEANVRHTLLGN